MLACARIGATHTVIFGGFAEALKDRLIDAQARLSSRLMAAGARMRLPLKQQVDLALVGNGVGAKRPGCPAHGQQIAMEPGRDRWWHEMDVLPDCPAEPMDSEDMLFILYTSGTTASLKAWCIQQVTISTPTSQTFDLQIPMYIGVQLM